MKYAIKSAIITETKILFCDSRNNPLYDLYPLLLNRESVDMSDVYDLSSYKTVHVSMASEKYTMFHDPRLEPNVWEVIVMQKDLPKWFKENESKYIEKFRHTFIQWYKYHVYDECEIKILNTNDIYLRNCIVDKVLSNANIITCIDTEINELIGGRIVNFDRSHIKTMKDNASIVNATCWSVIDNKDDTSIINYIDRSSSVNGVMVNTDDESK